jgi:uncharacterized protein involved in response to NO
MIQISTAHPKARGFALFALGFRPFFISAGLVAVVFILSWLAMWVYGQTLSVSAYYTGSYWHSHEMLFGYTTAVMAGFLLTAVRNWTGVQTLNNAPLAALVLVWLAGRLLPFFAPATWIAVGDLLFLPLLAGALIKPLVKGRNHNNLFFIGLLFLMAGCNGLVHAQLLGWTQTLHTGLYGMLYLIVLLIMILLGRVLPFFTERAIDGSLRLVTRPWLERLNVGLLVIYALSALFWQPPLLHSGLAFLLAAVNSLRLAGWYHRKIWQVPLLWVLHLGYAWLIFGFLLAAVMPWWPLLPTLDVHAMAVGGIGMMTLGMMARVSTGHTGRAVHQVPKTVMLAFALLLLAGVVRVILPALWVGYYTLWLTLASGLWVIAFVLFLWVYAPYLWQARPDGQAG